MRRDGSGQHSGLLKHLQNDLYQKLQQQVENPIEMQAFGRSSRPMVTEPLRRTVGHGCILLLPDLVHSWDLGQQRQMSYHRRP